MNFALIGDNPACLPLVQAIADRTADRLTHVVLAEGILADVLAAAPGARACAEWDELLADGAVDAALIAGHTDDVLEAARRLAQAEVALLVCPDARQGIEFLYELSLIRDDNNVTLYPAMPGRFERPFVRLCELIESGRLGRVLHLQLERHTAIEPVSAGPLLLSQTDIDRALLEDVDLLRVAGGDYNQVTAVYTGTTRGGVAMAHVALAGQNVPEASWSIKPAARALWKLMAIGEQGTIVLARGQTGLQLASDDIDVTRSETTETDVAGSRTLQQFEALMARKTARPDWAELIRNFELVEAARRSVRRRRTIDVHFDTTSERSIFKSQMTVLGCGVLTATLFAVVLVLAIGALFEPPEAVMRVLRVLIFLPLLLFLLLQLLLLITRPPADEAGSRQKAE